MAQYRAGGQGYDAIFSATQLDVFTDRIATAWRSKAAAVAGAGKI